MKRWIMPGVLSMCLLLAACPASLFGQTERWMFTWDGSGHLDDTFPDTIVGGDGNIYSAGYGYNAEMNVDILVVSVDPAGNQRWSYSYDNDGHDGANALIHGPGDFLYIAGQSAGPPSETHDLVVICLDTAGAEQWVYRYNGPGNVVDGAYDIHAGADGNLYVAGFSGGVGTEYDAVVVSLTPGGVERWVYRYDGPMSGQDRAYCVTSDQNDQIYLGGYTNALSATEQFLVIALDTLGAEQWVYLDSCPFAHQNAALALAFDTRGNLLAAGTSDSEDFVVISLYWKDGDFLWKYSRYTTSENINRANAILCGADGNIYVAGSSKLMLMQGDFTVVSLDGDGRHRWTYGYNGTANQWDEAWALTSGPDGTLYAGGLRHSASTARDALVVSLDPDGSFNWSRTINGSAAGSNDSVESLAWGADGHLYAGGFVCNEHGRDLALVKIDPDNMVSAQIAADPAAGSLPLETVISVNVVNNYREQARMVAARVDLALAGGQVYSNWRAGYMNIQPADSFNASLPTTIPFYSSTLGENRFRLTVEDITPLPYNQPPYPPSGDTDSDRCVVTGAKPSSP